jgi:hypothetical protein
MALWSANQTCSRPWHQTSGVLPTRRVAGQRQASPWRQVSAWGANPGGLNYATRPPGFCAPGELPASGRHLRGARYLPGEQTPEVWTMQQDLRGFAQPASCRPETGISVEPGVCLGSKPRRSGLGISRPATGENKPFGVVEVRSNRAGQGRAAAVYYGGECSDGSSSSDRMNDVPLWQRSPELVRERPTQQRQTAPTSWGFPTTWGSPTSC